MKGAPLPPPPCSPPDHSLPRSSLGGGDAISTLTRRWGERGQQGPKLMNVLTHTQGLTQAGAFCSGQQVFGKCRITHPCVVYGGTAKLQRM